MQVRYVSSRITSFGVPSRSGPSSSWINGKQRDADNFPVATVCILLSVPRNVDLRHWHVSTLESF